MRKSRAVVLTALVSGAALVLAACSTKDTSSSSTTASSSSEGSSSAQASSDTGSPSSAGTGSGSASATGGSTPPSGKVYTRPKVASSPNITISIEDSLTDYNNNTASANSEANSRMTALVQPSAFINNPQGEYLLDGDLMVSAELTSSSPETVVYKISPKAVWSDGKPVDCSDFYLVWLASISAAKSKDGQAFDSAGTTGYDQMNAPVCSDNGKTVTTTYKEPFADWKALFSQSPGILPAHAIETDTGVKVTSLKATDASGNVLKFAASYIKNFAKYNPKFALSAGPYTIKSFTDEQVVLVRNDKYWANPAGAESLTMVVNTDGQSSVQALQNQEVQVVPLQPNGALATQLKALQDVTFNAYPGATYEHIDFNMSHKLFQGATGLALRQAFFNCVDREDMIKKLIAQVSTKVQPLGSVIYLPNEKDYVDNLADYHTAHADKAKSLMEAAGWKLGADGIYALPDGTKASFKISHKVIDTRQKAVQLIQGYCKKAGIGVADDQDAKFNSDRLPKGDFDAALFAWVGNPAKSSGFAEYTTGGGANYNKLSDPTVDKLFKQANTELDPAKRTATLKQLDKAIIGTYSTLTTYQFADMIAQSNSITPVLTWVGAYGGPFWNANEWVYKK